MPILKHWWCPWGRNFFRFFRDRWWGIRRNVTDPQLELFHNLTTLFVKLIYYTMLVQERKKQIQKTLQHQPPTPGPKKRQENHRTISGVMSFVVTPSGTTTLWRRNLSLHCKSAGVSLWACIVTARIHTKKLINQN